MYCVHWFPMGNSWTGSVSIWCKALETWQPYEPHGANTTPIGETVAMNYNNHRNHRLTALWAIFFWYYQTLCGIILRYSKNHPNLQWFTCGRIRTQHFPLFSRLRCFIRLSIIDTYIWGPLVATKCLPSAGGLQNHVCPWTLLPRPATALLWVWASASSLISKAVHCPSPSRSFVPCTLG